MYVCICRAVTDRDVRKAIEAGARSVADVTRACCAGDDCGACHGQIEDMLEEHAERALVAIRVPIRERAA